MGSPPPLHRFPPRRPAARVAAVAGGLVDLVAFLCELAMLALLAVSGWGLGDGGLLGIALAVLYPALAVMVWTLWIAPRAERRLRDPWRLLAQLLIFAGTTAAAVSTGHPGWGIAFGAVAVLAFGAGRLIGRQGDGAGTVHARSGPSSS